eukprot:TRINITY_DN47021_c0_g1_i1.p1 TRINITY_DN47021_c0_g1~~TRINITY_DN47021_c0_g1_i1.p1  ORF type:complete len:685 (+),score=200.58 TRINITY_DN47021_c0_g1_i1:160-2214(+)
MTATASMALIEALSEALVECGESKRKALGIPTEDSRPRRAPLGHRFRWPTQLDTCVDEVDILPPKNGCGGRKHPATSTAAPAKRKSRPAKQSEEEDMAAFLGQLRREQARVEEVIDMASLFLASGVLGPAACGDQAYAGSLDPAAILGAQILCRSLERVHAESCRGMLRHWWRRCLVLKDLEDVGLLPLKASSGFSGEEDADVASKAISTRSSLAAHDDPERADDCFSKSERRDLDLLERENGSERASEAARSDHERDLIPDNDYAASVEQADAYSTPTRSQSRAGSHAASEAEHCEPEQEVQSCAASEREPEGSATEAVCSNSKVGSDASAAEDHVALAFELHLEEHALESFHDARQQELCEHIGAQLNCDSVMITSLKAGSVIASVEAVGFISDDHVTTAVQRIHEGAAIDHEAWGAHKLAQPPQQKVKAHKASAWLREERARTVAAPPQPSAEEEEGQAHAANETTNELRMSRQSQSSGGSSSDRAMDAEEGCEKSGDEDAEEAEGEEVVADADEAAPHHRDDEDSVSSNGRDEQEAGNEDAEAVASNPAAHEDVDIVIEDDSPVSPGRAKARDEVEDKRRDDAGRASSSSGKSSDSESCEKAAGGVDGSADEGEQPMHEAAALPAGRENSSNPASAAADVPTQGVIPGSSSTPISSGATSDKKDKAAKEKKPAKCGCEVM